jgi:flagellar hook-basal body complex protein FliE
MIKGAVDKIADIAIKIQNWVQEHPELAKQLTMVAGALGVFLGVVGTALILVPKLKAAWLSLQLVFTASPWGAIIAGIGLLIAAGIALWKNWDKVKSFFVDAWSYMKQAAYMAADGIMAAIEGLLGWIPGLGGKIKSAREALSNLIDKERIWRDARDATNTLERYTEESIAVTEANNQLADSQNNVSNTSDILDNKINDVNSSMADAKILAEEYSAEMQRQADIIYETQKAYEDYQKAIAQTITRQAGTPMPLSSYSEAGMDVLSESDRALINALPSGLRESTLSVLSGWAAGGQSQLQSILSSQGIEGLLKAGQMYQNSLQGYAEGGIVPGALGQPQLAIVHGGEEYAGVGRHIGGTTNIYVQGSVITERELGELALKYAINKGRKDYTTGL